MSSNKELEQNARIALLRFYSSQLISHSTLALSMVLIIVGLIQVRPIFTGAFFSSWVGLLLGFILGGIFLMGRLLFYGKVSNLVISVESKIDPKTNILNNVRNWVSVEFDRLIDKEKRRDFTLINSLFVKKFRYWSALILGFWYRGFLITVIWYFCGDIIANFIPFLQ